MKEKSTKMTRLSYYSFSLTMQIVREVRLNAELTRQSQSLTAALFKNYEIIRNEMIRNYDCLSQTMACLPHDLKFQHPQERNCRAIARYLPCRPSARRSVPCREVDLSTDEPVRVLAAGWVPANVYAFRRCPLAL